LIRALSAKVQQKLTLAERIALTQSVLRMLEDCSDSANRIPYAAGRGGCASATCCKTSPM